jgi:hypothetical protein
MSDIAELFEEFKTSVEKEDFIAKQHATISNLMQKNAQLMQEIEHLKQLLETSISVESSHPVERIIVTPEEALIDRQIEMIQSRGYDRELTLEDTKKLDLLIKNKRLSKEQSTTIPGEPKKYAPQKVISNKELIKIALHKDSVNE